jgi:hypothetical protein
VRDHRHHGVQLELPCSAAIDTVVSQPMTWKQTWFTISGIDGLIFPGMIDEPGLHRGQLELIDARARSHRHQRKSLAILLRSIREHSASRERTARRRPCSA